jgi:hypothetical protein
MWALPHWRSAARGGPIPEGGIIMTAPALTGRVAVLVANEGIEQIELTEPWNALKKAGAQPELIAPIPFSEDRQ